MKAMILAAGRGERMRPLTDETPKPLIEVNGKALIEYHIESLVRGGIRDIVINLAWLGGRIRDWAETGAKYGINITYSDESPEALETGGGIFRALPLLGDEPFWLVNGDIFSAYSYRERGLADGMLGHLVMIPNPRHHTQGDFSLVNGQMVARAQQTLTYSGIAILHPKLFSGCKDGKFPLAPILDTAIKQGTLSGERFDGHWTDVGTPERLAELDHFLST
jgi:MurNAc alpha-1-phosphate uridylyltransferase